jgi:phage host-nuclease inhibitor protein Gam
MGDVRWLGPYAPNDRHADDVTIDHIIELRKRVSVAEEKMNNALDALMALRKKTENLVIEINILRKRLEKYGEFSHDEGRHC